MFRHLHLAATLVALSVITAALPVRAEVFATCVAAISRDYYAAKKQYQRELRDLIVAENPDLTPLADLNMNLQTTLAEARHFKLMHLIGTDPKRITTSGGLSKFANFDWTPEDTATLAASSDGFRALNQLSEHLKQHNNGHKQWPALRAYAQGPMLKHPEFKALTARFIASNKSLGEHLKTCPPAPDQ
jgi:hypothetical protein